MADETLQIHPPEAATHLPPSAAEETDSPPAQEPGSVSGPPLASLGLDLQKEPLPPTDTETPLSVEEKLKEAVTVIEKDTPLEPSPPEPPLAEEHVTVAATAAEKDSAATPVSQPLAAALAVPQESESPKTQPKVVIEPEKEKPIEKKKAPESFASFKEESNKVSDLSHLELKALEEFKHLVQGALSKGLFSGASPSEVKDSFAMLKSTIKWRRDFNVDELLKVDLGDDLEKVVFMHGQDKDGHPVCYNVYGEFQNKELYAKTFGDEEKRMKFLRWRIQFLERSIRKLDFSPGGINTIFQDISSVSGLSHQSLNFGCIDGYIAPEQVPTQYGGLSVDFCECNPEFTVDDPATEITIKPATKQTVEIIVNEKCTLFWELRVVGWEVSYSAEYVPNAERGYTVIIQKTRKMLPTDEPVVSSSFNVTELGKILLTIDNPTAKKKKLLYRFKVLPYND
ncbi:UNVERIFIED_CONTAM: Patellin-3 [Sesamum radiatum]|uniref:Patellin-3 n=1 Tax=Sesamum radiatum TaxID=300843 RepID=A0AAW2PX06_SESRA